MVMTSKMIFLNICVAVIAFSLFLFLFLKPRNGSQFEIIQPKVAPSPSKIISTPKTTPQVTQSGTPNI